MSDMADVLAEHLPIYKFSHALKGNTWACSTPRCEVEGDFSAVITHQAAALSSAGFGPVREAADEAWELGVIHGHNTEGRLIDKREGNPYRARALAERGRQ